MVVDRSLLEAALVGYLHQRDQIDLKMAQLRQQMGGGVVRPTTGELSKSRHGMSPAGRARVAAAQRKRWAEIKNAGGATVSPKHKQVMSAAGRKRIADATRKRWAAYRAAKAAGSQ